VRHLTLASKARQRESGDAGSVYGQSRAGDTYQWQVRAARLILSGEKGSQSLTLDEKRSSSGGFILLVDGQEWTPCS
jgi:hypothetical protein